jgi:SNF2 family DNA or RNA helicase
MTSYTNRITGRKQLESPQAWRGGILADEMGLGKTLSMIALVASDKDHATNSEEPSILQHVSQDVNSTIIVVPPSGMRFSAFRV